MKSETVMLVVLTFKLKTQRSTTHFNGNLMKERSHAFVTNRLHIENIVYIYALPLS